jgi:beta-N-acetylhexosaminidase
MSRFSPTRRALIAGVAAAGALACAVPAASATSSGPGLPPPADNGWVTSTMARMTLE